MVDVQTEPRRVLEEALAAYVTKITTDGNGSARELRRDLLRVRSVALAHAGRRAGVARRRREAGKPDAYDYWSDPAHGLQKLLIEAVGKEVRITNTAHPDHTPRYAITTVDRPAG